MPNPKVIIQNIAEDRLTLQVNGEVREIQNQLAELKSLLLSLNVEQVQHAEKIYNIQHIDEANFGFVTGKKAFNEGLTKKLITAIAQISHPASRFLEKVKGIPLWESQVRIGNKAKEIIAISFVGVIGVELSKLMAIGKEDFSEAKQSKYIRQCLQITNRCLDLVCFTLLSKLWDHQKTSRDPIPPREQKILTDFFHNSFGRSILDGVRLLKTLLKVFHNKNIPLPISELNAFAEEANQSDSFDQVCKSLQELSEKYDQTNFTLLDCYEAEKHLGDFLEAFRFLVQYQMASIKKIGFRKIRNDDPKFIHRYTALGIDSKANVNAEKINCSGETVHTDTVLFYKGDDYKDNVDLFPFVIDYNALCFEPGAKICFYQSKNISDSSLEYLFLGDNTTYFIEHKGILDGVHDFNEVMMDYEKRKILNMDLVVEQFEEARQCLLGDASEPDFSDIFDDASGQKS